MATDARHQQLTVAFDGTSRGAADPDAAQLATGAFVEDDGSIHVMKIDRHTSGFHDKPGSARYGDRHWFPHRGAT